jgi:AcrR family transcriptional regulator
MSNALERRHKQREQLVAAAENMIAAKGLAGLRTRDLAQRIGVANGAVYNLVEDVDDLVLRVGSRTLARLDAALTAVESANGASPVDKLSRIAVAYCDFAAENTALWRALFEHRMQPGKDVPEWLIAQQMGLFQHVHGPLVALFPKRSAVEIGVLARSLFSAVHGIVTLGLEQKLVAAPLDVLRGEVARMVRAMVHGIVLEEKAET